MNERKRLVNVIGRSAEIDNLTFSLLKYYYDVSDNSVLKAFARMHIHTHSEIVICYSDTAELATPDGDVLLYAGDAVLIPHDYMHTMKDQKAGKLVWDALPFNCTKSERGERDLWEKYKPLFTSDTPLIFRGIGDLSEEIRSLISLSGKSDAISPVLRLALLVDRLSERKYEKLHSVINSDKHVSPELMRDDTRLTIINEIITSKFADDLDMNRIAEDLYVSRRHLDRLVKSRFGSTIRELINDNRLDLAEKMLRSTSDSVEKISSDAGFSSKESFRRAFLKKYGLSPSEYRIEVSKKSQ